MEKITNPLFWNKFIKVFIPFFILVIIIALLIGNVKDIFSRDFNKIYTDNFANRQWIKFFGYKFVITFVYAFFLTNKHFKA